MLCYHTAGESHGKALVVIVEGFPAGVAVSSELIDAELRRRQGGYGRGSRQQLEADHAGILSGLRHNQTLGSPIALLIANRDTRIEQIADFDCPRPGHADLAGAIKYLAPLRNIAERASARETAARVAAGALAKQLLMAFGIEAFGYVASIGSITVRSQAGSLSELRAMRDKSEFYTLNPEQDGELRALVEFAKEKGDTLGGTVVVSVEGVPFGLGSHVEWERRLNGRLGQAVLSVPSVKGVEFGLGFAAARLFGSEVHDPIAYRAEAADNHHLGFVRATNNAGGLEGGMSNSEAIVLRAAIKPPPTLARPLPSVNLRTRQPTAAWSERGDVCAVPAASCILENVVAWEIARALTEKFAGDSLSEMLAAKESFYRLVQERLSCP